MRSDPGYVDRLIRAAIEHKYGYSIVIQPVAAVHAWTSIRPCCLEYLLDYRALARHCVGSKHLSVLHSVDAEEIVKYSSMLLGEGYKAARELGLAAGVRPLSEQEFLRMVIEDES